MKSMKIFSLLCLFTICLPFPSTAAPPFGNASVVRVIDGDSVVVLLDTCLSLSPHQSVCQEWEIRLRGVDCPETHSPQPCERALAKQAKKQTMRLLPVGERVIVSEPARDKYGGRIVATLLNADGVDVSGELLRLGWAHSYTGGKKRPWCHLN